MAAAVIMTWLVIVGMIIIAVWLFVGAVGLINTTQEIPFLNVISIALAFMVVSLIRAILICAVVMAVSAALVLTRFAWARILHTVVTGAVVMVCLALGLRIMVWPLMIPAILLAAGIMLMWAPSSAPFFRTRTQSSPDADSEPARYSLRRLLTYFSGEESDSNPDALTKHAIRSVLR